MDGGGAPPCQNGSETSRHVDGAETAAHAHGHMVRLTELLRALPETRLPPSREEAGYLVLVAYHPDNRSTGT